MNSSASFISEKYRLLNPNLGHPLFIEVGPVEEKELAVNCRLLYVSSIENEEKLKGILEGKISIIPIIEYKWKFKRILEEERKKKLTLWKRIKNLFTRKKSKDKEIVKKLDKLEPRAYRGDKIYSTIINVEKQTELDIDNPLFLEDQYCSPQPYMREWKIFEKLNHFYCVEISFSLSNEAQEYFSQRPFLMCDILTDPHSINYHSVVLTKRDWKSFNFFHITDLHLAERNDQIFEIVSKWTPSSLTKKTGNYIEKMKNKIKSFLKQETIESDGKKQEANMLKKSLEKRFINPNNQFRKIIKIANKKTLANELDFIVLTGDIVDYVIKSKYAGMKINSKNLKFKHTNWKIFQDIILNKKSKQNYDGVIENGQELLCPIFTIVGNHDFRTHHYDLTWANLYKKLGLRSSEASALNELYSASPISSLRGSELALKYYLKEVNPSLDFSLHFGSIELVFLNSGADSFKNLKDLLEGHPSLTGLNTKQVQFLRNIGNIQKGTPKKRILLIHGPPINIGEYKYFRHRLQALGKSKVRKKIDQFKESILEKLGKDKSSRRIDTSFNVKRGTISSNWGTLIHFCKNQTILTLSGHTHILKEFRLEEPTKKSTVYDAPPFILQKIRNPAAVFYDIYSERDYSSREIEQYGPFIVQTPALGLGNYKKPKVVGAYREIKIRMNKLNSFRVYFLE
ncbi:MAG: hypothetical protein EU541_03010 [Promethearchaeota archaeon]|nr:MAG: hypothetical protein EU541_03010 [Candidatus Lokiarchaeota archaeon]